LRRAVAAVALATVALGACGGGQHEFTGYEVQPAPEVGNVTLPDLADGGEDFVFRASTDGLLLVYFGYMNCPHECPTTMTDAAAVQADLGDQVEVAMVTVDPGRDLAGLADYVGGFTATGHALGTDDPSRLRAAADAFGVTYQVQNDQVAHSTHLYGVDDTGTVVMTWTFPTPLDALRADVKALLG